jgi:hypothetical protein
MNTPLIIVYLFGCSFGKEERKHDSNSSNQERGLVPFSSLIDESN